MVAISATCWVEIDLGAVRSNVAALRRRARPAGVAAVVKADGYGHGAVRVARAALEAGAAWLCVFTVREALALRGAGIEAPILCMGPVLNEDPAAIAEHGISAVVDSSGTAARLAEAAERAGRAIGVQINLDSGMQRYGLAHAEGLALAEAVHSRRWLDLEAVFTHFPDAAGADSPGRPARSATLEAFEHFQRSAERMGAPMRHAAASAAALQLPETSLDLVRAGIALYGIDPAPQVGVAETERLGPVLSWRTRVLAVREVRRGEAVSYGGLWRAERDSRIGVVGAGYADGLARGLSPGGELLVRGERVPIRGAICMDSTMIDLTEVAEARVGDTATIIGRDGAEAISAWELARRLGTIPYEVCTGIGARVPRIAIGESD